MPDRIEVAVGVLVNKQGELLVQQRRAGTACAGQWEFPGGKLEALESPQQALCRELAEELGIIIAAPQPLTVLEHDYPHAKVRLHAFICPSWDGAPRGREGQLILWAQAQAIEKLDLLEAATPLLRLASLQLKR